MKIFLDSDTLLDVVLKRPYMLDAQRVLNLIEKKKVRGFTSPVILTNIFYILSKETNREQALIHIKSLKKIMKISPVNQRIIGQALQSQFADFEDAVQHFSALSCKVNFLITRNKKDYKHSKIRVTDAATFLQIYRQKHQ